MENIRIVCSECNSVNSVEITPQSQAIECKKCSADLNDPFPLEVSDESCTINIQNNDIAVLVDFYSTTCGPCMAMYEDYEDAALGFGLKVKFLKINADEYQQVAREYGVSALPTIIAFKKGKEVNRISSQLSRVELDLWAKSLL